MTEAAHDLGADGFLVVTPYYNKPPQRGIVAHFEAIAQASDRPIVVYNIPSRVIVAIEPETITRLAEIDTVRAVKQADDELGRLIDTFNEMLAEIERLQQRGLSWKEPTL
jgi:4-hydroxy-tetrahydrodipicolinate synthase